MVGFGYRYDMGLSRVWYRSSTGPVWYGRGSVWIRLVWYTKGSVSSVWVQYISSTCTGTVQVQCDTKWVWYRSGMGITKGSRKKKSSSTKNFF